jgi:hypothetical protein
MALKPKGFVHPAGAPLLGWATKADAETPSYSPAEGLNLTEGTTTLYAVWGQTADRV